MKRLITILAVFSLVCLGAGVAIAESSPPAGYDIIDFVNIGDSAGANTEGGRNMTEWGPSFDAGIWFSPENSDYYRQIWGWTTPPATYPAGEDSENWATIELDFTKPAHTGQLNLGFYYLAGAGLDNFNVYIDGTLIGEVTEIQGSNIMVRKYLAVPGWVTAGDHTVKLECSEPAWASQATYGQVTFDEIYTFTDPWIDPVIAPVAVDSDPIKCGDSKVVNFHYVPGSAPEVKGYTVRVTCDAALTFDPEVDVTFFTLPSGASVWTEFREVTAGQDYYLDYAILGGSSGISAEADLFSVNFHGAGTGTGTVSITSVDLRDLDNGFITPVVSDGTANILVDCVAPETSVDALPTYVDSFFDITYTIDLEAGSGVTGADLWYQKDGGGFINFGPFAGNTISFDPTTTGGDGVYEFYSIATDGAGNIETATGADATTTVDSTKPETSVDGLPTYVDSFFDITYTIDLEAGSGVTSADLYYQRDGGGFINYGAFTGTTISFDATTTGGDGVYEFYSIATDGAGNIETATGADATTTVDTSPPDGITGLTAVRGKEKVKLTWANNGGVDQTGVEMWRAVWHNGDDVTSVYPEYNDVVGNVIPTVPGSRAAAFADPAWTEVDLSTETYPFAAYDDLLSVRGIYYYVVYPVDGAGLYGDGDDASSISYLLGDVQIPYDGLVFGGDITVLSIAYGTTTVVGGASSHYDVGPTDDYSGSGIPQTDDSIDFDDLMIFALNWGTQLTKVQPTEGSQVARFSWMENDDSTWSLVLTEPCANLKGVNLQADLAQDASLKVSAGSLLGQQENSYFLQNIPDNGLDAGLALLGTGACITGQGELIRISLTGELDLDDIDIEARDSANKVLEYSLEEATAEQDMPTKYMLSANYPNPFNPSTKIDFALPETQHVRLAVYSIDGRQIATLKNESMPAGRYTVTWTGRDEQGGLVASGIYFYRIQAGDFSRIEKMTLLK